MTSPERPDARPWQERQRRLREDAVLDAAAELLDERGFSATSMDEIAARVGISKPTLYQHFPSKDAVAATVLLRRLAWAAEDLARAEAAVDAGAPARPELERVLHRILAERAGLCTTHVEVPRALLESPPIAGARADVWGRIGALVDRAKREGTCRRDVPTALVVGMFVGLLRGEYRGLVDGGREGEAVSSEAIATALVSLAFDGLAPRAETGSGRPREPIAAPAGRAVRRASALLALVLGGHAAAHAQPRPSRPLADQQVPLQTVPVPGVPAAAGGRVPGAPATGAAVAGRALRLVDVLDAALRANPTARASLAAAEAARAQAAAARGAFAPALTFAPGFLRSQTIPTALPPAAAGAVPRGLLNERTQFSPALGLNFLLLDFGGRAGLAAAARESANAAEATFDATVATTVLQAEQAYFDYQSARQVVEAQDENVRTAALNRDAAVARYRAGLATVADTLQAATALGQARVTALAARSDVVNARAALATVVNARADAAFVVAADSAPTAAAVTAATAALTARVDTLVAHAVRRRPDVDATRDLALAATEQIRVARSAQLPAVVVNGSMGYNQVRNIPQLTGTTYNVQVGLAFNLFDNGLRRANVRAATASAEAARLRADAATTQAANETVASAEQLRVAADRVVASDALLGSAARNEEVARGRYREGVGTVVDLLTAQTLLFTARAQNAQARWGWATALARLARDAGVLGARGELPAVAAPALPPGTPLLAPSATVR